MLWLTEFTHWESLPPWLPSYVQTIFFRFSATTNNNGKSGLATQDHTSLDDSYYFSSCSLIVTTTLNPRRFSEKHICYSIFECVSICFSSGVVIYYGTHTFSCTSANFSGLDLVWQPGPLINMDGIISLKGPWGWIR